ncbi:ribonuclease HII [Cryobacterium sp. TMT2-17-1]|uniref:Ribonuclease n=1 Tax=Cryobacterium sandaracinum TaxID=1259247 RepID=A0ABY2JAB1_9MICO|nr:MULTISPECIES: ribonuclease HII [Cryobacterium]TFB58721.1 ribonuclease HII [Cryobacterium sp. Hz7]TFC33191.1 ribonuclease HII [Cryobacterium sp. TMT2-14]TFC51547.1 ribonuclease HII [Cryobacterium sp. TMT2-17-1]TFD01760.1 ribonuclease HII [Cryobacterium sandaracinum]
MVVDPTLDVERALLAAGATCVIGVDEVGRGALAGPVGVGVAVVNASASAFPAGLRDSKMLSEPRRGLLAPLAVAWALHSAVGLATPLEVDRLGIIAALGLAGKRALAQLFAAGVDITGAVVLLDGNDDWLNRALSTPLNVVTRVRADQDCASVAAASVIAKVHRDALMIEADAVTPGYEWAGNKGYGSPAHMAAIALLGPTLLHRKSWLKITA